jgi:hypothetical protein
MLTKTVEGGEPELVLLRALNAHAGPQKRVFSEALKSLVVSFQRPMKSILRFSFLREQ